jgi:type VI secretion system protein ImpM
MTAAIPPAATGLYGKLPRHGDYVRRGLPEGFAPRWGDWLGACMEAAQAALGREGLAEVWPAMGAWRFRAAAGLFGPWMPTGVLVPSHDAVGRAFPLTLLAPVPAGAPEAAWFGRLEELGDEAAAGGLDADGLAAALHPASANDTSMPTVAPGGIAWWRQDTEAVVMPLGPDNLLHLLGQEAAPP